ncbi:zinc metalloprotease [Acidipropionibacterium timonense]|uniref:hypothetical protein n=1 Tax=Acidipropionibacterium timonense TaxID=2161818 RepID=UPI00102FE1C3|nr:hypothetical protein [Acidipropionibacterium timonense]
MKDILARTSLFQTALSRVTRIVPALLIIMCMAMASILLSSPGTAHAYALTGCKSTNLSRKLPDYYATGIGMTVWYSDVLDQSTIHWWRNGVSGGFKRSANYDILVKREPVGGAGYWMMSYWSCDIFGHMHARSITVNSKTTDGLEAWKIKYIFIHEFGHQLGLAHTDYGCGVSIMRGNSNAEGAQCPGSFPPWSDDLKGYHHIYG